MQTFIKPLEELAEYVELRGKMKRGKGVLALSGCTEAQKAHMIYGLSYDAKNVLVITENDLTARTIRENLAFYCPNAGLYPAKDLLFYQADIASNLLDVQRMRVMKGLIENERNVVVLPAAALMDPVMRRDALSDMCIAFDREDETDLDWAKESLVEMG